MSSEILDVDGNNVTLVLGKEMRINSGNLFEIFTRDKERNIRNRIITLPGKSVGIVEIKNVSDDASEGEIIRKWGKVKGKREKTNEKKPEKRTRSNSEQKEKAK